MRTDRGQLLRVDIILKNKENLTPGAATRHARTLPVPGRAAGQLQPQGRGPREIGGDAVTECRRLGLPAARQAVRTAGHRCNARARIRALTVPGVAL